MANGNSWCGQSVTACNNSNDSSCNRAYDGVNNVPEVVDERNLVGNKVKECEDHKRSDEPVLSDEGEARTQRVQVQPAHRECESKHRQIGIQAGGECQAERCTEINDVHDVFLPVCMMMLLCRDHVVKYDNGDKLNRKVRK